MNRFTHPIAIVLTSCALVIGGCAKYDSEAQKSEPAMASAEPAADSVATVGAEQSAADEPVRPLAPPQRKLIQTAELRLEVASYPEARRALDRQVREVGGYLANAEVEHHDGQVSRASLVLRIPADELASFLAQSADVGTVLHESLATQDISDQYADLAARLRSARKLEERYLALVSSRTDGVKDLLEVERELARVRERIESMDGKIRRFDEQVAFSTLQLELVTRQVYAASPSRGLGERAATVLHASWAALIGLGKGLVLLLAGLLPWLPLLAAMGWLMRWSWRRFMRRLQRPPTMPPTAQPPAPRPPLAPSGVPPQPVSA